MTTNTKKVRARWMNRLAQAGLIHLTGFVFYKGIAIPLAH